MCIRGAPASMFGHKAWLASVLLLIFYIAEVAPYSEGDDLKGARLAKLTRWLKENGAEFHDMTFLSNITEGRGVRASDQILNRQNVAYLPRRLLMSPNLGMDRSMYARRVWHAQGFSWSNSLYLQEHITLAVFLMHERSRGEASFFHSYVDTLPRDLSHLPLYWDEDKLRKFGASEFPEEIIRTKARIRSDYDELLLLFRNDNSFLRTFAFEDFKWARAQINARAFRIYPEGHVDQDDLAHGEACTNEALVLAPVADMLNHRDVPNVVWSFDVHRNGFTMTASEDIAAGAAVYDSYGSKNNLQYMKSYGFALPEADMELGMTFYRTDMVDTCMAGNPFGSSPVPLELVSDSESEGDASSLKSAENRGKCFLLPAWQEFLMDVGCFPSPNKFIPRARTFQMKRDISSGTKEVINFLKASTPAYYGDDLSGYWAMVLLMTKTMFRIKASHFFTPMYVGVEGMPKQGGFKDEIERMHRHLRAAEVFFLGSGNASVPAAELPNPTSLLPFETHAGEEAERAADLFTRIIRNGERKILSWYYYMGKAGVDAGSKAIELREERRSQEFSTSLKSTEPEVLETCTIAPAARESPLGETVPAISPGVLDGVNALAASGGERQVFDILNGFDESVLGSFNTVLGLTGGETLRMNDVADMLKLIGTRGDAGQDSVVDESAIMDVATKWQILLDALNRKLGLGGTEKFNIIDLKEILGEIGGDFAGVSLERLSQVIEEFSEQYGGAQYPEVQNFIGQDQKNNTIIHVAIRSPGVPEIRLEVPFPGVGDQHMDVESFADNPALEEILRVAQSSIDFDVDGAGRIKNVTTDVVADIPQDQLLVAALGIGSDCVGKYDESNIYYPCHITGIMQDGSFQVEFYGLEEWTFAFFGHPRKRGPHYPSETILSVRPEDLIPVGPGPLEKNVAWVRLDRNDDALPDANLQEGQSVFARWQGNQGNRYYIGVIQGISDDGKTFLVNYNDGDVEDGVEPQHILRQLLYKISSKV